jgi:hypothetical protein
MQAIGMIADDGLQADARVDKVRGCGVGSGVLAQNRQEGFVVLGFDGFPARTRAGDDVADVAFLLGELAAPAELECLVMVEARWDSGASLGHWYVSGLGLASRPMAALHCRRGRLGGSVGAAHDAMELCST